MLYCCADCIGRSKWEQVTTSSQTHHKRQGKTPRVASQTAHIHRRCAVCISVGDKGSPDPGKTLHTAYSTYLLYIHKAELSTCHRGLGSLGRWCSSTRLARSPKPLETTFGRGQQGRDTPVRARVQPAQCQASRLTKPGPAANCRLGLSFPLAVSRRPRSLQPHGSQQKGKYCSEKGRKKTQTTTRPIRFL